MVKTVQQSARYGHTARRLKDVTISINKDADNV
jgi:hypothetical protein